MQQAKAKFEGLEREEEELEAQIENIRTELSVLRNIESAKFFREACMKVLLEELDEISRHQCIVPVP
ncbi:hypothetical protein OAM69_03480 [bacterium]|nr:hypothetical protein [bacterium]